MKIRLVIVFLGVAGFAPGAFAAACVNGMSNGAECSHVEFAGHLSAVDMNGTGEVLNDIWGWADTTGNGDEYAIVGMQDGTAFVRILDDGTPVFLGRLMASDGNSPVVKPGARGHIGKRCHDELCGAEDSAWRDVKVHDHYAYIVSEAQGHGLQVFDLHHLRGLTGNPPQNFNANGDGYYDGIGHAHNLFINEETARAYVVGHNTSARAGGLHILDLSLPANPQFIGEVNDDGYTHDVQCVLYDTGPDPDIAPNSELCFASNEDTLTIWDVTDAANAEMLSRTSYSQSGYTHQGWLSEDRRYFFLNDELDERASGSRTHLRVFDVSDVNAPALAAEYFAPTLAIDHNNYVHGRWLLQSNYGAGLRILDVLDPLHPVQAAYFDPQPSDEADFYGTWSNFLFPSGLVAFSDINNGLYVVRPTLSIVTAPDVAVALTLDVEEAEVGETVEGGFIVSNDGASDASDVLVTLHLPAGEEFTDVELPQGDWSCDPTTDGRVVECRVAQLPADASDEFFFSLTVQSSGTKDIILMAYANEADAAPADNLDSVALEVTGSTGGRGDLGGGGVLGWLLAGLCLVASLRPRRLRR